MGNKTQSIKFHEYAPILLEAKIPFAQKKEWLQSQAFAIRQGWLIHLSVIPLQMPGLITVLIPLLQTGLPFRMVASQFYQYQLNSGAFGYHLAGQDITLVPSSNEHAFELLNQLIPLTGQFSGPVVEPSLKITDCIFVQYLEPADKSDSSTYKIEMPAKSIPFPSSPCVSFHKQPKWIGNYVVLKKLKTSVKGNHYHAVSLKNLSFRSCFIKEAKPHALCDHFDRDMQNRLSWQMQVTQELQRKLYIPKFIDYIEAGDRSYLVTEYIEGVTLEEEVKRIYQQRRWTQLNESEQELLLSHYFKVLNLVFMLHGNGYVHRDITHTNFMVDGDRMWLIDLEMAYSLKSRQPDPPFVFGTIGFVSPEQRRYETPTISEDIYALGALLLFFLTGLHPLKSQQERGSLLDELTQLTLDEELTVLAVTCLDPNPERRPAWETMLVVIGRRLSQHHNQLLS